MKKRRWEAPYPFFECSRIVLRSGPTELAKYVGCLQQESSLR